MGRTYTVPRNVKGESRLLYIFTMKSIVTTAIFAALGLPIFFILNNFGMTLPGLITLSVFGAIGYFIGVLKIPDTPLVGNLRKAGGEEVSDILIRIATFGRRKKIYVYRPSKAGVSKAALKTKATDDEQKVEVNNETEKSEENTEGEKEREDNLL